MKIFFALIAVLLAGISAKAQGQYPTHMTPDQVQAAITDQEKCKAEAIVWSSDLKDWYDATKEDNAENTAVSKMGIQDLYARGHEMLRCYFTVPFFVDENGNLLFTSQTETQAQGSVYKEVMGSYDDVASERLDDFLDRHHLRQQFLDEDAAGLR